MRILQLHVAESLFTSQTKFSLPLRSQTPGRTPRSLPFSEHAGMGIGNCAQARLQLQLAAAHGYVESLELVFELRHLAMVTGLFNLTEGTFMLQVSH